MKNKAIVHAVAKRAGVTVKDTEAVMSEMFAFIGDELAMGKSVQIRLFGTFEAKRTSKHIGRNPHNGQEVMIPSRVLPKFRASKVLKKKVGKN